MIKKISFIVLYALSLTLFACENALPTDNPGFCTSFRAAAYVIVRHQVCLLACVKT